MFPSSTQRKSSNPRKQRTIYAGGQTRELEASFQQQRYMVGSEREALASKLGLSEAQVRVWFQNRRSKHRKESRTSLDLPSTTTLSSPIISTLSTTTPQLIIPSSSEISPSPLFSPSIPSFEALSDISHTNIQMKKN
ncbi:hypothetical protein PMAYCL1PPCAC_12265 [Pristionchus mayeri]|uniref:Homeobox domain-containing protein n=1 Tax=Pristionchus mayeri TaxID=1317129 RepID=A0AAN4ZQU9_9BILA|nr:hypothetical protein PMAYCL1PPCAC_12265 [Pristionchus mayeri]